MPKTTKTSFMPELQIFLTKTELRQQKALELELDRKRRNFWIRVARSRGYTNARIAKEFGLTESTVRGIIKSS